MRALGDLHVRATLTVLGQPDRLGDLILPGAVDAWLEKVKAFPMLYKHDKAKIVGQWSRPWLAENSGKVRAWGVIYGTQPDGEQAIRDIAEGMRGVSIGFRSRDYGRGEDGKAFIFRSISIYEASLVRKPAHPEAYLDADATQAAIAILNAGHRAAA